LFCALRNHLRMEKTASSRCRRTSLPAARRSLEFARRGAVGNDGGDGLGNPLHVATQPPALLHRDFDHLVQFSNRRCNVRNSCDGSWSSARADGSRRFVPGGDGLSRVLDAAIRVRATPSWIAFSNRRSDRRSPGSFAALWRCRRRWSFDSRFRETNAPHHENPFSGVVFDMFRNQRHGSDRFSRPQCSIIPRPQQAEMRLRLSLMLRRKIKMLAPAAFFKALAEPIMAAGYASSEPWYQPLMLVPQEP